MSGCSRAIRAAIATALAAMACALPVSAHADSADPYLITQASVCTITTLTITTTAPVSEVSTATTTFGITAQGSCVGQPPGSLSLFGSGVTSAPATCEAFASASGMGTITIGSSSGSMMFDLAGVTAAPLMAISMQPAALTGIAALVLSPASLEACLLGGTTVLQYTGAVVFAL